MFIDPEQLRAVAAAVWSFLANRPVDGWEFLAAWVVAGVLIALYGGRHDPCRTCTKDPHECRDCPYGEGH